MKTLAILFLNHDFSFNKIKVENPTLLYLFLFLIFTFLIFITLKKTVGDRPLSILQTDQIKGLAIIIIIIHHLSIHTIANKNSAELLIGFVGVALFLILSGFGLSLSLEKKGIKNFFSKRFIRVYIPVSLALLIEVILNHILLKNKNNIWIDFLRIFTDINNLDRNYWFIIFLIFWYCIIYLVFWLNLSKKGKIIFLFSTSLIILALSKVLVIGNYNALSFPFGCWLGLNYKFICEKVENLLSKNILLLFTILISCIFVSIISFYLSVISIKNGFMVGVLLLILIIIFIFIYGLKKKAKFENNIEIISIVLASTFLYFNYFHGWYESNFYIGIFRSILAVSSAIPILLLVSLLVKFSLYSYFLNFIGKISFELYLIHGMFMYSFDFILFRGNIAVTFFIYFIAICMVSLAFRKINSIIYDSLLKKLN
jgi:peptidoglycan/LPS O-acetylase OafA/YrhL